jgi:hypothetical protein
MALFPQSLGVVPQHSLKPTLCGTAMTRVENTNHENDDKRGGLRTLFKSVLKSVF